MDTFHFIIFACYAFALGACVASFLNVCIWRLPRGESVISPPSHCPRCGARIRWYQNIPIISWCALRGRCAACHEPIAWRYTLVETLGGVLFLLAYLQWAMPFFLRVAPWGGLIPRATFGAFVAEACVAGGLILGAFIDLDHYYLPDRVTIGGMILGVPFSLLVPELQGVATSGAALAYSLGGAALGFFFLWGLGAVFSKILKKDALGFGDVKLMGAIGAFFGPAAVLFTLVVSSLVGSLAGLVLILRGRARIGSFTAVPYGPFLAIGALAWMYWGPAVWAWYTSLLAPAAH